MTRIKFSPNNKIRKTSKYKRSRNGRIFLFLLFIFITVFSVNNFIVSKKTKNNSDKPIQIEENSESGKELKQANILESKPAKKKEEVIEEINEIVKKTTGTYGFYIYEPDVKEGFGINEEMMFPAASTVKVPLLLALYKEIEKGTVTKNQTMTYLASDYEEGTGSLQYTAIGGKWTISQIAEKMMKQSDNVSKNMIFRLLGYKDVQSYIKSLGALNTNMSMNNTTTPKDAAFLLDIIYKNKAVNKELSEEMIELMTNTSFEKRLPRYLQGIKVSHKIGTWGGAISDVGIVFVNKPYIITVYNKGIQDVEEAEKTIGMISKIVYDYEINKK